MNWDSFDKYCIAQLHYKVNTLVNRKRYLRHLMKHCNIDVPDSVFGYFALRISNGTKGYHLNNYIKAVNAYYKFMGYDFHFKLFKEFEKPVKIPTVEDVKLLLRNCPRSKKGKLYKTVIYLFCYSGLRNEELCSLTFDDIDWRHNEIRLVGKWDRPRVIPIKDYVLHGDQVPSLDNYIRYHRYKTSDKYVFTDQYGKLTPSKVREGIKTIARCSGLGWVHPHSFRHFYATSLLSKGINVKIVQILMGHGDISQTSRYLHAVELDIRRVIDETRFDSLLMGGIGFNDMGFNLSNFIGGI